MGNIFPPVIPPPSFNLDWMTGYRKMMITGLAILISTALLIAKVITGDQWTELNKFVIPAFLTANIAERWLNSQNSDKASD